MEGEIRHVTGLPRSRSLSPDPEVARWLDEALGPVPRRVIDERGVQEGTRRRWRDRLRTLIGLTGGDL